MALVNISKAAQLAGTTRSNLYNSYINQGKLSVTKDHLGKPKIDTSELIRVFGTLKNVGDTSAIDTVGQENTDNKVYEELVQVLKSQIEEMREREEFYQRQILDLQQNVKLLTNQNEGRVKTKKKWWLW